MCRHHLLECDVCPQISRDKIGFHNQMWHKSLARLQLTLTEQMSCVGLCTLSARSEYIDIYVALNALQIQRSNSVLKVCVNVVCCTMCLCAKVAVHGGFCAVKFVVCCCRATFSMKHVRGLVHSAQADSTVATFRLATQALSYQFILLFSYTVRTEIWRQPMPAIPHHAPIALPSDRQLSCITSQLFSRTAKNLTHTYQRL